MFKPKTSITHDKILNKRSVDEMRRMTQDMQLDLKIPDKKRPFHKYVPRVVGLSNMGINEFWCFLFERNELVPKSERMTDEAIRQAVMRDFPGRYPRLESGKLTVQAKRIEYMQGRLSSRPRFWSNRYDENGDIYVLRKSRAIGLLVTPDDTPDNEQARVIRDKKAGVLVDYIEETE